MVKLNKWDVAVKQNKVSDNTSEEFAWYSSIETLGAVDGPGLRLVIFLQGCPLNCLFCHNPETIPFSTKEKKITIDEILKLYEKNKTFYQNGGGITFSGGEAMAQIDFVTAAFKKFREKGIHTCLDTAAAPMGVYPMEKIEKLLDVTDYFLVDIKHPDQEISIELSGEGVEHQIGLLKLLESRGQSYLIRHVYLPTFSDRSPEHMQTLGKMIGNLKYMDKFEFLPYHDMAKFKYENMGWNFPLAGVEPPTTEQLAWGRARLQEGIDIVRKDPSQGLVIQD